MIVWIYNLTVTIVSQKYQGYPFSTSYISDFEKWKLWAIFFGGFLPQSNYKLWPKKKVQSSGRRFKFCLKKHSACFLIWAGVKVLRTLAISMQLFPYFSYSYINILCSSSVYLPLFILQSYGKLYQNQYGKWV